MNEKSWASLAPLLDHRRYVESIVAGITVYAHPDFRCAVTMNEDESTYEIPDWSHEHGCHIAALEFIRIPQDEVESSWGARISPPAVALLDRIRDGNSQAHDELVAMVYERLHSMARRARAEFKSDLTLGPTSLLHEAYLKLLRSDALKKSPNRRYFFSAAAGAMRQLLIDHLRRRHTRKRGGDYRRVPLDDLLAYYEKSQIDLLAFDEVLSHLESIDLRKFQVVQLRFFLGMTMPEIAEELGVAQRTVETDWQTARAFLRARWPN